MHVALDDGVVVSAELAESVPAIHPTNPNGPHPDRMGAVCGAETSVLLS